MAGDTPQLPQLYVPLPAHVRALETTFHLEILPGGGNVMSVHWVISDAVSYFILLQSLSYA
jgi:hypothetical protein